MEHLDRFTEEHHGEDCGKERHQVHVWTGLRWPDRSDPLIPGDVGDDGGEDPDVEDRCDVRKVPGESTDGGGLPQVERQQHHGSDGGDGRDDRQGWDVRTATQAYRVDGPSHDGAQDHQVPDCKTKPTKCPDIATGEHHDDTEHCRRDPDSLPCLLYTSDAADDLL